MRKEDQKIAVLTAKEILLNLVDVGLFLHEGFDARKLYRQEYRSYWKWRNLDRARFSRNLYKLKKLKLINIYREGKDKYIELTPRGLDKIRKYHIDDLMVKSPKMWDQKWRIVIFDIPNDKKTVRDIFRNKLKRIGFIQLQESVFIFPFECKTEIKFIAETYYIEPYVKYVVADFFQDDNLLIEKFIDDNILTSKMIGKLPRNTLERKKE